MKFLRPSEAEGQSSFFNILVLHQNRAEGRGRKNAIYESMIPEWMDVVVWGHEHECQTQFVESLHGRFRVLQPGSTVATSLVDGEAAPKHLAVLELREQQFRLITYRLKNVRPFLTDEVRLDDEEYGLDAEDAKVEASIDQLLEDTVTTLVQRARAERKSFLAGDGSSDGPPANTLCVMQEPNQVLVRVKVDRLGFQTLNNQRFGARFVGDGTPPSSSPPYYCSLSCERHPTPHPTTPLCSCEPIGHAALPPAAESGRRRGRGRRDGRGPRRRTGARAGGPGGRGRRRGGVR